VGKRARLSRGLSSVTWVFARSYSLTEGGKKNQTHMFFCFSFFFISYGNFYLLGSFLVKKNFVPMLPSLEKLELGINKLFFPVKKRNRAAKVKAGCH